MTQKKLGKVGPFFYVVLCEKSEELERLNTPVMRNAYEKNILAKGTFLILLVDFDYRTWLSKTILTTTFLLSKSYITALITLHVG